MQGKQIKPSIRNLTKQEITSGVELILQYFQPNQPLTKTFTLNYPSNTLTYDQRKQLWTHWITVSIQKQLILGLFYDSELVGLTICKDINYELPQIQQEYSTYLTEEKCFIELQQQFISKISKELQQKLTIEGNTLQIMIVVVHQSYQGKGLSQLLIAQSNRLACLKGKKYCYCQASNFKTAKSLHKNKFNKLLEIDLRDFEVLGVKPFCNISEQDRKASSWIKMIQN